MPGSADDGTEPRANRDDDPDDGRDPRARERPDRVREEPVQASWPAFDCFGCGPANPDGLHLHSFERADGSLVASVDPDPRFKSGYPNVTYGGLIASLVDCHSIWTAITAAYRAADRPLGDEPRIAYATGELDVTYHRPTPLDGGIDLHAWVDGEVGRRTAVTCEVSPGEAAEATATGQVTAVRVDWGD